MAAHYQVSSIAALSSLAWHFVTGTVLESNSLQMFAYAAKEHCARHGTKVAHFAKITSKNRTHGSQNPRAAIQVSSINYVKIHLNSFGSVFSEHAVMVTMKIWPLIFTHTALLLAEVAIPIMVN